MERLRQYAERSGSWRPGAAGTRQCLRHLLPGGARDAGDVPVLRTVLLLWAGERAADCCREGALPRRVHRLFRLGQAQLVADQGEGMTTMIKGGAKRIRVGIIGANPDRGWAA